MFRICVDYLSGNVSNLFKTKLQFQLLQCMKKWLLLKFKLTTGYTFATSFLCSEMVLDANCKSIYIYTITLTISVRECKT